MVRLTPRKRLVSLAAICFLASLGISACSAAANITATPTSVDEARALAQALADKAGCGSSFEDYIVNSHPDRWKFTCQMNDDMFEIIAFGSPKARSEYETQLRETGWQYWSQDSYTIVAPWTSTIGSTGQSLEPFKKALDHSKK
jgi:hypothetical protein